MQDWIWFVIIMLIAAIVAGFMAGLFGIGGGAVMVPVFSEVYVCDVVREVAGDLDVLIITVSSDALITLLPILFSQLIGVETYIV